MADKIEPALSAEEWAKLEADYREDLAAPREPYAKVHAWSIAVANRRLPDSDPRKITRDRLEEIRYYLPDDGSRALIDALESYLPPWDVPQPTPEGYDIQDLRDLPP